MPDATAALYPPLMLLAPPPPGADLGVPVGHERGVQAAQLGPGVAARCACGPPDPGVSVSVLSAGPIICGVCGTTEFLPAEPND